jgi:FKBP-type peptidyl-prolyl cis-trans isomerase
MSPALIWTIVVVASLGIIYKTWKEISRTKPRAQTAPQAKGPTGPVKPVAKLNSEILKEGTGPGAKNRDILTVHYQAKLIDGTKVDSSYDRGRSFTFKLGVGAVIMGWDSALKGAKAGEKRVVSVPADLAYGKKGSDSGKIPPGADVIFEIDVLKVEST